MREPPDILVRVEQIEPGRNESFAASVDDFLRVQVPAFVAATQDAEPAPLIRIGPGDI